MKIKKTILIILIIIWMISIFKFSSEKSEKSTNTSGKTIEIIVNKLNITKGLTEEKKQQKIEELQPIVRKLAHFSLYMVGGILAYLYSNCYKIIENRKILYSLFFCFIYAITDEFHQSFVPGRSAEALDVLIDSSGAFLGIIITYAFLKTLKKIKNF